MLRSRHPREARRGDITRSRSPGEHHLAHRRRPRRGSCLPDSVRRFRLARCGESANNAASGVRAVDRDGDGGGGGQSGWWPTANGREDPASSQSRCSGTIGGRTYRVACSLRCATNRSDQEPTTGRVFLSGPRQQVHRCVRRRGHRRLITHHANIDPGTEATWRGTRDRSPRSRVPQPHTRRTGSGHPQYGRVLGTTGPSAYGCSGLGVAGLSPRWRLVAAHHRRCHIPSGAAKVRPLGPPARDLLLWNRDGSRGAHALCRKARSDR
jgi:hypothetical protein